MKKEATIAALLCRHRVCKSHLNHILLSACWSSISQLVTQRRAERCWLQKHAEALEPLVQHTMRAAEAAEIGARELANVAYAMACSGWGESLVMLFTILAQAAGRQMSESKPQELANTAWSFATVGQLEGKLFAALARAAKWRVSEFNA